MKLSSGSSKEPIQFFQRGPFREHHKEVALVSTGGLSSGESLEEPMPSAQAVSSSSLLNPEGISEYPGRGEIPGLTRVGSAAQHRS